jgi:transposase
MSQREAARHFNISRDSVRKMMAFSVPPGYRRQAAAGGGEAAEAGCLHRDHRRLA